MEPRPSDASDFYPPRHELLIENSELTRDLIRVLHIQREPDIEETTLYIDTTDNNISIPSIIMQNLPQDSVVSDVYITSKINRLTNQVDFTLEAYSSDETRIAIAARSGEPSPISSTIIDDVELPSIEPLSKVDFNRFLGSFITRNKIGDFSMYDAMDVTDPRIAERLITAIIEENSVDTTITDAEYFLDDELGPSASSIRFIERDEDTYDATITVNLGGKGAFATKVDFRSKSERMKLHPSIDANTEYAIQILEGVRTYDVDINGDKVPVASTNDHLMIINEFLQTQLERVFADPIDDFLSSNPIDDVADQSSNINIDDERDFRKE